MKQNKPTENKKYIFPAKQLNSSLSHKRNLDLMKLLISHNEFQKDIQIIRDHLKLPAMGFSDKDSPEDIKKWHENLENDSYEIWESKKYIEQEQRIKKNFRDRHVGHSMANKQLGLLSEKAPLQYLRNRAGFTVFKFKLPVHFAEYIERYIVRGTVDAPQHNYIGGFNFNGFKREKYLDIKVYTRLAKDEIKELQAYINWLGHGLPKYHPIKDIDLKLKIEDWYENKTKADEADYYTRYKTTNSKIAKEFLGSPKKEKRVGDFVRSIKKTREKMFGNPENTGP